MELLTIFDVLALILLSGCKCQFFLDFQNAYIKYPSDWFIINEEPTQESSIPPVNSEPPESSTPPVTSEPPESSTPPVTSEPPESSTPPEGSSPPESSIAPESSLPTQSLPPEDSTPPDSSSPSESPETEDYESTVTVPYAETTLTDPVTDSKTTNYVQHLSNTLKFCPHISMCRDQEGNLINKYPALRLRPTLQGRISHQPEFEPQDYQYYTTTPIPTQENYQKIIPIPNNLAQLLLKDILY